MVPDLIIKTLEVAQNKEWNAAADPMSFTLISEKRKHNIIKGFDKILKEKVDKVKILEESKSINMKKLEIQDKLIKDLKTELKEKDESSNANEDMEKIQDAIKELQMNSMEKVELLKSMIADYEKINTNLEELEN